MKDYRIKPGTKVNLSEWDPKETGDFYGGKDEGLAEIATLNKKLAELQVLLYAGHRHKLLIVLQAMDTGGKDGTISRVFEGINPQGVRVARFNVPTQEELDHDYLWRVHAVIPAKGEMVIFNRSHYEDVLVVRVHNYVPSEIWEKRFDQINQFERFLVDNGTTILKFYLHIDRDEQKKRLQSRLDDPAKRWKFRLGDLEERKLWSDYMQAYEDVLSKTSTDYSPWFVVPANRNWYRDLVVSSVLVDALESLAMKFPEPEEKLDGVVIE
jgi:PPK2 family polyphosphate:nucleotide phosphotransferase